MDYIRTNMHPTQIQKLEPVKVGLPDGSITPGSFVVVSENNQGQELAIEYTVPTVPGQIRLQRGPGNSFHRPQRPVTTAEFEQWQKDHNFVFKLLGKTEG
jgi:hypothetical protein